ncbi:hypothetical protein [Lacticaseibacillus manihotivorans]|uniref:hypothetical protein n=1 Tax=Lacticaseibacillus manihotivorans TaxID=88233 RepID=UPI0006D00F77|nr:hypothetical protein [Lacticaseibacillus manihotivorans]
MKESSGVFGSGIAATPLSGAKYVIQDKATGKYFNGFKDGSDADSVPEAQWLLPQTPQLLAYSPPIKMGSSRSTD